MILSVTWEKDKECKRSLISRVCFRVSLVTLLTLRTFAAEMPVMWFEQRMIWTCGGGTGVSRAAGASGGSVLMAGAARVESDGRRAARTQSGEDGERWAESGHDGEAGGARRGRRATRTESDEDGERRTERGENGEWRGRRAAVQTESLGAVKTESGEGGE